MPYDPARHHRRSIRLKGHDYASPGVYFVTVCTWRRELLFGQIANGVMDLNAPGRIAAECWAAIPSYFPRVVLDEFVVMPNHIHGILMIGGPTVGATQWVAPTPVAPTPVTPTVPTAAPARPKGPPPGSIGAIMAQFKSVVTKRIHALRGTPSAPVWQRNYYEHIIRDDHALAAIRRYIRDNALQWTLDRDNPVGATQRSAPEVADDYLREAGVDP